MISNKIKEIVENRKKTLHLDEAFKKNLGLNVHKNEREQLSHAIRTHLGIPIISEIKPASPTLSNIRIDLDVKMIAREMESAGVVGLSVLTEPNYFQGSYENLQLAVNSTKLPCLLKDFVIDPIQLEIAALLGATNVLIINSICNLIDMHDQASLLGLEPLIEIHNREEIKDLRELRDNGVTPKLIGVNNRNLKTMEINLQTSIDLIPQIKELFGEEVLVISESGINTHRDIQFLQSSKADAYLIGSLIMKSDCMKDTIVSLRGMK